MRDACNMCDAECTKTPDTNPSNDLSELDATKMIAAVRSSIHRGIPDDVRARSPTGCLTQHPSAILGDVRKVIVDSSYSAHRRLESMAKRQQLTQTETIAHYIMSHRKLRKLMYQSDFPFISNELTIVRYIVNGLYKHPHFQ